MADYLLVNKVGDIEENLHTTVEVATVAKVTHPSVSRAIQGS